MADGLASRQRRAGRPAVTLGLFLVGVVLAAVGIGVGLTNLLKRGVEPTGVLGALALVIGLFLVVRAGAHLTRLTPRWWRLFVVPLLLLAAVGSTYLLAVPMRAALPARAHAPASAPDGVPVEEVVVPTGDGEKLAGWFVAAQGGPTVVLLPGAGSARGSVAEHLRVLADSGHGVLALDPRGQGDSSGRGMDWGWWGEQDVPAAVTYLTGREDVDPGRIAVLGLSMGGEQAIGAAGVDPRIRAVVAEGVTGRQAADLHWLSDVYGWRGTVTEGADAAQTWLADMLSPAPRPPTLREAVSAAAPRPTLLIVAGERPDEAHATADIQAAAPDRVQVWIVPGSAHTGGLSTDPSGWTDRVISFLEDATREGSPS